MTLQSSTRIRSYEITGALGAGGMGEVYRARDTRLNAPYGELAVVDLASEKMQKLTNDGALALSPAWSPDSRSIYFASSRGGTMSIWKIAAEGGKPQQITSGQGDNAELDVSSDGKKIVFSTWCINGNIARFDLTAKDSEQTPKLLTTDPARNQLAPVYSPDGKLLTYFSNLKGAEKKISGSRVRMARIPSSWSRRIASMLFRDSLRVGRA